MTNTSQKDLLLLAIFSAAVLAGPIILAPGHKKRQRRVLQPHCSIVGHRWAETQQHLAAVATDICARQQCIRPAVDLHRVNVIGKQAESKG